jgi:hypothetical protein
LHIFEVQESVQLSGCHARETCVTVLAIHLIALAGHFELICHVICERLNIDGCSQKSMDQYISISSNWGSEMCIKGHCQTIMEYFSNIKISEAEIHSLVHASCRHNSDKLIEEWVAWLNGSVKTLSKGF